MATKPKKKPANAPEPEVSVEVEEDTTDDTEDEAPAPAPVRTKANDVLSAMGKQLAAVHDFVFPDAKKAAKKEGATSDGGGAILALGLLILALPLVIFGALYLKGRGLLKLSATGNKDTGEAKPGALPANVTELKAPASKVS